MQIFLLVSKNCFFIRLAPTAAPDWLEPLCAQNALSGLFYGLPPGCSVKSITDQVAEVHNSALLSVHDLCQEIKPVPVTS